MREIDLHLERTKKMIVNDENQTVFVANMLLSILSGKYITGMEQETLLEALETIGFDFEIVEKECKRFLDKQPKSISKIDENLERIFSKLHESANVLDFFVSCCKNENEMKSKIDHVNLVELGAIYTQYLKDYENLEVVSIGSKLEEYVLPLTNITELALDGRYSHLTGREDELEQLYQALAKQSKPNAILIGAAGVGKTAIIEMLAEKITSHDCPDFIREHEIYSLDLNNLVAGTIYRGEFEAKIKTTFDFLNSRNNPILFIDEIHNILGAGSGEGTMDFANIVKPYLTSSKVKFIGATTIAEYNKHIMKDKAIVRRFKTIQVSEPSKQQTLSILNKVLKKFEAFQVTDSALQKIVELTGRFIPQRTFPDKAIDLLEEVISCQIVKKKTNSELVSLQRELANLNAKANVVILSNNYTDVEKLNRERSTIEHKLKKYLKKNKKESKIVDKQIITENDVINVFSKINKIPLENIKSKFISGLYDRLKNHIVGQDEALKKIEDGLAISQLLNKNKPLGCFLLIGSSRVGKTETAKAIAKEYFSSNLIRVDCGEIKSYSDLTKIKGSTAGYVGYGDKCTFDEVKTNPYSVLLFDEIEKAHNSLYDLLLSILDEGKITDSQGDVVDFRSCLIILTSNIGVKEANTKSVGYTQQNLFQETLTRQVTSHFKPEFLNRLDIVFYQDLDDNNIEMLLQKYINNIIEELKENDLELIISNEVIKNIINETPERNISKIYKKFQERLANGIKNRTDNSRITIEK